MPLYEYECDACGRRFEVIQKFADDPIDVCTQCGKGPVRRLLSSPAIQFKGSGWYITDYSQKGKSDSASTSSEAKTGDAAKSDSTSTSSDSAKTTSDTSASPAKRAPAGTSKE
jgi:putative FmdB family regulatory protein